MPMKKLSLLLLATMLVLSACKSKDDKKKVDQSVKLVDIENSTVKVQKVWGASVGGGGKKLRLGLGLAKVGDRIFAVGADGEIAAFNLQTGKQLWRTKTKVDLSGGTGASLDLVAVGSADG